MSIPQRTVLDPDRDVLLVPPTYRSTVATATIMALALTIGAVALAIFLVQPNSIVSPESWVVLGAIVVAAGSWIARVVVVARGTSERLTLILSAIARAAAVVVGGAWIASGLGGSSAGAAFIEGAVVIWFNGRVLSARIRALRHEGSAG